MEPQDRKNLGAAAAGLFGGFGAGVATMAGPQAYPKAPPIIWEILLLSGLAVFIGAILYLLYEYCWRPRRAGKPKLDPLQIIGFVAAFVLMLVFGLQLIRGPYTDTKTAQENKTQTEIVKLRFVKKTPKEILQVLKDLPPIQATQIGNDYVGDGLERAVTLAFDPIPILGAGNKPTGASITSNDADGVDLRFSFGETWIKRVGQLSKGDKVKLRGEISNVSKMNISMTNSEIVDE